MTLDLQLAKAVDAFKDLWGNLNYLNITPPNITYSVRVVSQFHDLSYNFSLDNSRTCLVLLDRIFMTKMDNSHRVYLK